MSDMYKYNPAAYTNTNIPNHKNGYISQWSYKNFHFIFLFFQILKMNYEM